MKIGKKIVKGILLVIAICLFLLSLSTVVPQIPILGSIANHITVHYAHIYLPVSLALLALGVLCLCLRRNVSSVLLVVLLAANLILDATAYSISFTQFKKQGGDATFLSGHKRYCLFFYVKKRVTVMNGRGITACRIDKYQTDTRQSQSAKCDRYVFFIGWIRYF